MTLSRFTRGALAAALVLATAPAMAKDAQYSNTIFFGDSLTDSGYFRPVLIRLIGADGASIGKFTTNPNLVWSEHLAERYGTQAQPNGNGQTGTNYSAGGARVDVDVTNALGQVPALTTQLERYLQSTGGKADPNALYSVWGGANDLFSITTPASAPGIISGAVTAEIGMIAQLKNAGARYILVPNIPDLGMTPTFIRGGAAMMAQGTAISTAYNDALYQGLAGAGLQVIPVNANAFLHEVVANPGAYGFTNVTGVGCRVQPAPAGDSSLFCNPGSYVTGSAPDTYLFADGVHPGAKAHEMISQLAVNMLEAPRQIAVLPLSASTTGRSRADTVANHVVAAPESDGMRWWTNLRGDYQRYGHGDDYDGMIPALSGGIDWTMGNVMFGAFAGYGRGRIDFGMNRGDFRQTDATLGGFVGWYADNGLWVNGQVSYTKLDYDVNRDLQLGPARRTHKGSADGSNLTLAAHAGWNITGERIQHGPVLSLISQKIEVDGFAENDPALSTSLAYADQSYDSLIGSIGWQISIAATEHVTPYARLTWDKEFEDAPAFAKARAQSIPTSLEYAVPGLDVDDQYGTVVIGARTNLYGLTTNIGGTTTVNQHGGANSGVFLTVGKEF